MSKSALQIEHEKAVKQVFEYEQAGDYQNAKKTLLSYLEARQQILNNYGIKQ